VATTINRIADCGFSDGFETGSLSDYWSTYLTNTGRVQVITTTAGFSPHGGSYQATLDSGTSDSFSQAALILTADLANKTDRAFPFSR
jgi:hypothetical protein